MGVTGGNVRGALDAARGNEEMGGPELVWLKPRIDGAISGLDAAARTSRAPTTPEVDALKKDGGAQDQSHDNRHRFSVKAFELAELELGETSPSERKIVTIGKRSLYPDGLDITQRTWKSEADETALFQQRLERPEVVAALVLVRAVVPGIDRALQGAVAAGQALGKTMRELAILEAGSNETPQMFAARTRGMQVLALLRATVDEVYPPSDKANAVVRERLIGRYLELLAEANDKTTAPANPVEDSGTA